MNWAGLLTSEYEKVGTCQVAPAYLVTVCSPEAIFGLGSYVSIICVFHVLYFYQSRDRQYIMSPGRGGYIADKGKVDVLHSLACPGSWNTCTQTAVNQTYISFPGFHANHGLVSINGDPSWDFTVRAWTAKGKVHCCFLISCSFISFWCLLLYFIFGLLVPPSFFFSGLGEWELIQVISIFHTSQAALNTTKNSAEKFSHLVFQAPLFQEDP